MQAASSSNMQADSLGEPKPEKETEQADLKETILLSDLTSRVIDILCLESSSHLFTTSADFIMQTADLEVNIPATPKILGGGTVLLIYLISFFDQATLCVNHPSSLLWRGKGNFHFPANWSGPHIGPVIWQQGPCASLKQHWWRRGCCQMCFTGEHVLVLRTMLRKGLDAKCGVSPE